MSGKKTIALSAALVFNMLVTGSICSIVVCYKVILLVWSFATRLKDLVEGDLEGGTQQCVENSKMIIGSGPLISKAYIRLGKWMQQQEELVSKKMFFNTTLFFKN